MARTALLYALYTKRKGGELTGVGGGSLQEP